MSTIGDIRPSQIITTFGPGSIVDLRTLSVIIAGLDYWNPLDEELIDEPRLLRALGKHAFYRPASRVDHRGQPVGGVPTIIFPAWLVCPRCGRLAPWQEFVWEQKRQRFLCKETRCPGKGNAVAFPSRFIVACPNGHLDDFPWLTCVHGGQAQDCQGPLKLVDRGLSGSISDLLVVCEGCGARRPMGHAFGEQRAAAIGPCTARRPWLGTDDVDPDGCDAEPRPLLRGASNAWFPVLRSALSIPPWVNPVQEAVGKYERHMIRLDSLEKVEMFLELGNYPELERFTAEEIWSALQERRNRTLRTVTDLLWEEWLAFRQPSAGTGKTEFETRQVGLPPGPEPWLARVVQATRLREVRAILGFTRIDALGEPGDDSAAEIKIAPLSRRPMDWLPAVEIRGEGIFIEFHEDALRTWENRDDVKTLSGNLSRIYALWRKERGLPDAAFPGIRYVLLHSIAHMLIRQLSLDCGYSASSIRERIYCSSNPDKPMAGILLYTAVADSEGSLGGLVELGEPDRFGLLMRAALRGATVCSSDPLCAEHRAEEHGILNGAACHACLMVSETSCERGNRLLDRNLAVPTFAGSSLAFFPESLCGSPDGGPDS